MEVHRQHCQNCGSMDAHNIIVREPGEPTTIFVRCMQCHELVARYQLRDYLHHGKDIESFIRSHGALSRESARDILRAFEEASEKSQKDFQRALAALHEEGKEA
ncbi:MAG: hypothetical protein AAF297_02420 [Planctomycetota bacterium]